MIRKPMTPEKLEAERRKLANREAWEAIERMLHAGTLSGGGAKAFVMEHAPTPARGRAALLGLKVIEGGKKV